MKVSIVTISFNQARFLEAAIRSVIEQDYPDIEYIVVDAGSNDGSRDIIDKYRSKISRVILEKDEGPADGLNKGFGKATGEILAFLNADDFYLPGAVRTMVDAFRACPKSDVISAHAYVVDEHSRVLRRFYSRRFSPEAYVYGAAMLAQQSTFFKADSFRKAGGFNVNNRIAWDAELWVEMARKGAQFSRHNAFVSCFRIYRESISGSGQMSGLRANEYRARIFRRVMNRDRSGIDVLVKVWKKAFEYSAHPRILFERVVGGETLKHTTSGGIYRYFAPRVENQKEAYRRATYRLFKIGKRCVFAVPAEPRSIRHVAISKLLPTTGKRALYQKVVQWGMGARLDWILSKSVDSSAGELSIGNGHFDEWLSYMRAELGLPAIEPVIAWPKQKERRRIYVHLVDVEVGRSVAFCKVAFGDYDIDALLREAGALRQMRAMALNSVHVPRVILEGKREGIFTLGIEPLPNLVRPLTLDELLRLEERIEEWRGPTRRVSHGEVQNLSWWKRYCDSVDERCALFDKELRERIKVGIDVGRAHGDISLHNVAKENGGIWVFDWEESANDAPALTDEIALDLLANRGKFRERLRSARDGSCHNSRQLCANLMMALAFRHASKILDATKVIHNWPHI